MRKTALAAEAEEAAAAVLDTEEKFVAMLGERWGPRVQNAVAASH